mmetsp:Transcript_18490/g.25710  ORF Transcript_18490/g.25710 Transcript_18490/m.25710 type:complete len:342 (+) Transcript_18490:66-1091(+)
MRAPDKSRELGNVHPSAEGWLWSYTHNNWEKRWFVASNGWLRAYRTQHVKKEGALDTISLENSYVESVGSIPSSSVSLRRTGMYRFKLHAPNSKRMLTLSCQAPDEFGQWINILSESRNEHAQSEEEGSTFDDVEPVSPGGGEFSEWLKETKNQSNTRRTVTVKHDEHNHIGDIIHTYYGSSRAPSSGQVPAIRNADPSYNDTGMKKRTNDVAVSPRRRNGDELEPLLKSHSDGGRGKGCFSWCCGSTCSLLAQAFSVTQYCLTSYICCCYNWHSSRRRDTSAPMSTALGAHQNDGNPSLYHYNHHDYNHREPYLFEGNALALRESGPRASPQRNVTDKGL